MARNLESRFSLRRVVLNSGGYDSSGRYFGSDAPLWYFESELIPAESDWIRAPSRDAAKEKIRALYPGARFWR